MTEPTAPPSQQAAPVCPRHPSRVSYVRCQRCGRPVCPECQRPAAVGVQCVDCVKSQAKTVRRTRTVFGGSVSDTPVVSYAIIAICVVVYLLQVVDPAITEKIVFDGGAARHQPWRFLTAAFAHGSITHILFNMLALWAVGAEYLEKLLGGLRYAAVYLVSALGGSVVYMLFTGPRQFPYSPPYQEFWSGGTVGASGAVFGLFGALLVLNRHLGRSSQIMYATIGINAVIGFLPGQNIAWQAHLGGLVTGAAVAAVIALTTPRERRRWQWPGVVLVVLVLVAVVLVKYAAAGPGPSVPVVFFQG
jgi:membrane associated rhomboid family serine protease